MLYRPLVCVYRMTHSHKVDGVQHTCTALMEVVEGLQKWMEKHYDGILDVTGVNKPPEDKEAEEANEAGHQKPPVKMLADKKVSETYPISTS